MLSEIITYLAKPQSCNGNGVSGFNFTSCKTYHVCTCSTSYMFDCATNSIFDQRALKCESGSICPDTDTCKANGFYSDPNYISTSYYVKCTRFANNFAVTYLDCGSNKIFVPPLSLPATTANCIKSNVPVEIPSSNCVEEGTFQVYHTNCTTYMVCQKIDNSFLKHTYLCSMASRFDPWGKMCVLGYKCLEGKCIRLLGLDENDRSGNHYYQCVRDSTGRLLPIYLKCGTYMKFNEIWGRCE